MTEGLDSEPPVKGGMNENGTEEQIQRRQDR
jgi:hypothetical protein